MHEKKKKKSLKTKNHEIWEVNEDDFNIESAVPEIPKSIDEISFFNYDYKFDNNIQKSLLINSPVKNNFRRIS